MLFRGISSTGHSQKARLAKCNFYVCSRFFRVNKRCLKFQHTYKKVIVSSRLGLPKVYINGDASTMIGGCTTLCAGSTRCEFSQQHMERRIRSQRSSPSGPDSWVRGRTRSLSASACRKELSSLRPSESICGNPHNARAHAPHVTGTSSASHDQITMASTSCCC